MDFTAWPSKKKKNLSFFLPFFFLQESMDRTSSRRPEELIVPGFQSSANQNLPHHHGNSPLLIQPMSDRSEIKLETMNYGHYPLHSLSTLLVYWKFIGLL